MIAKAAATATAKSAATTKKRHSNARVPSPRSATILKRAAEIRESWDDDEHRHRAGLLTGEDRQRELDPKIIHVAMLSLDDVDDGQDGWQCGGGYGSGSGGRGWHGGHDCDEGAIAAAYAAGVGR